MTELPAFFAAVLGLLPPTLARATDQGCSAPSVEADSAFNERYPGLLDQVRQELAGAAGLDACARVELRRGPEGVLVAVSLPDGRRASRELNRPDDVLPTLQALLLVPDSPEPLPTAESKSSTKPDPTPAERTTSEPTKRAAPRRAAPRASVSAADEVDRAAPVEQPRELGFELSAVTGVRIGDGQVGYGGGVLSFLEIKRWLIGFQGRADGYRSLRGGDPDTALELGILGGKRFDLGGSALDLTLGPALAMRGMAFSQSESVAVTSSSTTPMAPVSQPVPREEEVGPSPRLLLAARWGFRPRSTFRTFIGIDGEIGPSSEALEPDAARMPLYTVGLSLGATVGTH